MKTFTQGFFMTHLQQQSSSNSEELPGNLEEMCPEVLKHAIS